MLSYYLVSLHNRKQLIMSFKTVERTINQLSQEYSSHLSQAKKIEHTLEQQTKMMTHRTIPKMYRPQVLTTINPLPSITEDFNKEFETIFFKHLERIMTNNNMALEIKRAHLSSILSQVDHHLINHNQSPDQVAHLYSRFIQENHIDREIPRELKKVLPPKFGESAINITVHQPSTSKNQTRLNRKHSNARKHPKAKKCAKHFLSPGPPQPL